jgi:pyrimidine deaminase RibD-like protein
MTDDDHMRHALALGRRALGVTGARPAVGCVIVHSSKRA